MKMLCTKNMCVEWSIKYLQNWNWNLSVHKKYSKLISFVIWWHHRLLFCFLGTKSTLLWKLVLIKKSFLLNPNGRSEIWSHQRKNFANFLWKKVSANQIKFSKMPSFEGDSGIILRTEKIVFFRKKICQSF